MYTTLARLATTSLVVLIVVGCSPAPATSPSMSGSPASSSGSAPSLAPGASATPAASPGPSTAAAPGSTYMPIETATFPVRGSARELGMQVQMAPGPDGSLLVTIPTLGGSTLSILDKDGKPREGWPTAVVGATPCGPAPPALGWLVRVVCTLIDLDGDMLSPTGVFAFDPNGRLLPGWPLALDGNTLAARMVGDELTMFASWPLAGNGDGQPTTRTRTRDDRLHGRSPKWEAGPDVLLRKRAGDRSRRGGRCRHRYLGDGDGSKLSSEVTAMDHSGVIAGWPRLVDGGIAATPAFMSDGRILVAAGSPGADTS